MKNYIRFLPLVLALFIYSCKIQKQNKLTTELPIVQMDYYEKNTAGVKGETFLPPTVYPGMKKKFFNKSKIEVKANHDEVPISLNLQISKKANSESGWENFIEDQKYQDLFDGKIYSITSKNLFEAYSKKLPNNRFLRIIALKKSDNSVLMEGYFKVQKRFSFFKGFSSPVLFRVTGNPAGFNLYSISPSLGLNFIKWNFNNENFENISLDLLVTVTSYPKNQDTAESYQYTMAVGGVIDLGGYIQLGPSYSFLEKKTYLVIGIKPYLFSKLFGSDR